jgi:endoglucanase
VGRGANNRWGVLDTNSASDADVWMAHLLEADEGGEPRYARLGASLAKRIADERSFAYPRRSVLLPGVKDSTPVSRID